MAFAFNKRFGIDVEQFAQLAQKLRGAVQANRRLQVGALQRFAQHAAELAVHANVDIRFHQTRHIGQVAGQWKDHVDLGTNALHQAADFGQIAGRVEGAVAGSDDVDAGLFTDRAIRVRLARRHFFHAVFAPQPVHGAVGALPLVFVDSARQKALDIHALGRDTAANHFGNGAGDHHRR